MQSEPVPEHAWLKTLIGEWSCATECVMPDGSKNSMSGHESVRALGDMWVIGEMTTPIPDLGEMRSVITLGFDPKKKRYVGSWVGAPMAQLITYEGDRTGDTLTLNAEGPHLEDPEKTAQYQDIIEFISPDERLFRSQILMPDGSWNEFMVSRMKREA